MSNYGIVCDIVSSGHGSEKRVWTGLTKEEVVVIEKAMVVYLEDLAKKNAKRLKGDLEDPVQMDPASVYNISTTCTITKDGKEWAVMSFRLPNITPMYITILSFLFNQHLSQLPGKIKKKMVVTR